MASPLALDRRGASAWITLAALVVVVAVVLGVYVVYFIPKPLPTPLEAQPGDTVYADYIGYFQDTGRVFDTSLKSVGQDNATWPKAVQFAWRQSWSNLSFTIGAGAVVKGFDQGVVGMSVGDTKTISFPASLGYGPMDPTKVFVHHLVESVPMKVTMNESTFSSTYGSPAVSGSNVSDPVYRWSATVTNVNGVVTVTNSPYPGEVVKAYGLWTVNVLSVDTTADNGTGLVWIQNVLSPSNVDAFGATAPNGQTFYVSAVDTTAGTYTLNFNKEVVGRTLTFVVTLLRIGRIT